MALSESQIAEAREWHARLDALSEVGRVFSAANATQLRSARDSLSALLAKLDDEDQEDPKPAAVKKALGDAKKAAGEAADMSHDDLRQQLSAALNAGRSSEHRVWVRDVFDDAVIYEDELDVKDGIATFRRTYSIDAAGSLSFGDPERVRQRSEWVPAATPAAGTESQRIPVTESAVQVQERAVADDGAARIKLIDAGWGSSGYYSEDVLRDSGPAAFPAGTKMYWDHPTAEEAEQRPERSLRDLAAELTEDAAWDDAGPDGPGLYAAAQIFGPYRPAIDELAPHIGASIRTWAMSNEGEADGRTGPIIEELIASPANSVDFVTLPGRGGSITQLYESYRHHNIQEGRSVPGGTKTLTTEQLTEQLGTVTKERDDYRGRAERAETAVGVYAARDIATEAVRAIETLPDASKLRIIERATPVLKDGEIDRDATRTAIDRIAADEADYLERVLGKGAVSGMGAGAAGDDDAVEEGALEASFARLGLSESAAKTAARGRSH